MITLLQNWTGSVEINGTEYETMPDIADINLQTLKDDMHIKLLHKADKRVNESVSQSDEYTITVKQYMTKQATPDFDFMMKWNNNNPMPARIMTGTIEKETRGMVYMKLYCLGRPTVTCLCCGKELTNPVSRIYGIGPICLSKMGISRDIEDVEGIKEDLAKITWEGWIIKSAILEQTPVE